VVFTPPKPLTTKRMDLIYELSKYYARKYFKRAKHHK